MKQLCNASNTKHCGEVRLPTAKQSQRNTHKRRGNDNDGFVKENNNEKQQQQKKKEMQYVTMRVKARETLFRTHMETTSPTVVAVGTKKKKTWKKGKTNQQHTLTAHCYGREYVLRA